MIGPSFPILHLFLHPLASSQPFSKLLLTPLPLSETLSSRHVWWSRQDLSPSSTLPYPAHHSAPVPLALQDFLEGAWFRASVLESSGDRKHLVF